MEKKPIEEIVDDILKKIDYKNLSANDIIHQITTAIEIPMITEKFDNNWKEYVDKFYGKHEIIDIAFYNGRKVQLLETFLKLLIMSNKIN